MKLTARIAVIASAILAAIIPSTTNAQYLDNGNVDCLAQVMHHEAGGEGRAGQTAVAYVVLNRAESGVFPRSVCGVIRQRSQFTGITRRVFPESVLNRYRPLASSIISSYSRANDPTNGAMYFHNTSVRPRWGNLARTVRIGQHIFYRMRARR